MQEINSHSRVIETLIEKGKTMKPKDELYSEISLNDRYNLLRQKINNSIILLENYLETYEQYQDLHKLHQDTQNQLWDQLSIYTGLYIINNHNDIMFIIFIIYNYYRLFRK